MPSKPSRLYRVLADCPKPIFECVIDGANTRRDDDIQSITIRHGQEDAEGGVPVATMETAFSGYLTPRPGQNTSLRLTTAAADYLANFTGATGITDRFVGRTGTYSVDDTPKRTDTTMAASSWHSQLGRRSTKRTFLRGAWVSDALTTLLTDPSLPVVPNVTRGGAAPREKFGQVYDPVTDQRYSDVIDKFTSDIGVLVRQWRSGTLELVPLAQRIAHADAAMASYPPIARSQVLSPTEWGTRFTDDPSNHRIVTRNASMEPTSLNFGDLNEPWRDNRETDLQYLYFSDNDQWVTLGEAGRYNEYTGAYKLPEVEIDLLTLFKRGTTYDLMQAGALLRLQAGDAVTFSGDWYPHLRGVQFAEGITETITPDAWKITLHLVPLGAVTGEINTSAKPRIWDQFREQWDNSTGSWDSYSF